MTDNQFFMSVAEWKQKWSPKKFLVSGLLLQYTARMEHARQCHFPTCPCYSYDAPERPKRWTVMDITLGMTHFLGIFWRFNFFSRMTWKSTIEKFVMNCMSTVVQAFIFLFQPMGKMLSGVCRHLSAIPQLSTGKKCQATILAVWYPVPHYPPQPLNTNLRSDLCLRSESPASAKRMNRNPSRSVGGARQRTTFPCLSNWVRKCAQGEACFTASPSCSRPSKLVITALLSLRLPQNSAKRLCRMCSHLTGVRAPPQLAHHPNSPNASKRSRWWTHTAEMWHLMVSVINRMHTCNSLPHREPCCGYSGRTQMAATWWVPTGPFDGSGQDMNTHTQMATHWEWAGDGHVDYWFAQINDSQPGHRWVGDLLPQSWHSGVGTQGKHRRAHEPGKLQQHSFCVPALYCCFKTARSNFKCSSVVSFSHQCYCLCIYVRTHFCWSNFFNP